MHPEKSKASLDQIRNQNRFLRGMAVVLGLSTFAQTGLLFYVFSRDSVRIVPPVISRPYVISGYGSNPEYLSDMAEYVLTRMFNVNPSTIDFNNESVLKMVDPEQYPALKTKLDTNAERIKKDEISTIWSSGTIEAMPDQNMVFVKGVLSTYMADKIVNTQPKEYLVEFIFRSTGRLYVSKVKEVVRDEQGTIIEQ